MQPIQTLWHYRGFILGSLKREFQLKYRNSQLGVLWTILQPLAMILVYTLVFSELMKARLPGVSGHYSYSIYLCSGILLWGYFSELLSRCLSMFIDNANLLKKLNFPKLCLPVIVLGGSTINFLIIFGIFLSFIVISGNFPGKVFLALPCLIICLIMLAMGLGIAMGVLNVFFRDVGQFFSIFIQFWFWATPIIYPADVLPEKLRIFFLINPIVPIIEASHTIFVQQQWPNWKSLIYPVFLGISLCVWGLWLFRRHVNEMMDEL